MVEPYKIQVQKSRMPHTSGENVPTSPRRTLNVQRKRAIQPAHSGTTRPPPPPKKRKKQISSGDIPNSMWCSFWCSHHHAALAEPRGTLVDPWYPWNPRGTLPQSRPEPPRSLSGLRPQSFQLLGKNRTLPKLTLPPSRFIVQRTWLSSDPLPKAQLLPGQMETQPLSPTQRRLTEGKRVVLSTSWGLTPPPPDKKTPRT